MDIITKYICPICHREYDNEQDARKCLNLLTQKPLVKIGNKIKFKDCEETPILYNRRFTNSIDLLLNSNDKKMVYVSGIVNNCIDKIFDSGCIGKEVEYEVVSIEYIDHEIYYYLGHNGKPAFAAMSFQTEEIFKYPIIIGNELMQKILDLYNERIL